MSVHGGNIVAMARALGCEVKDLIDMSSNLTPLAMVPGLREVLVQGIEEIAFLPETESENLRQIFARKFNLQEEEVLVGNGTTEFIFALPHLFAGSRAIIVNPTYSDYRVACSWAKIPAMDFMLPPEQDFHLDLDRLAREFQGGELVFICNPNNPTGALTPSQELYDFILRHPATSFLVDESYLPFTREKSLLHYDLPPNLFVLFSSSKIYGIPGLRLGFLVARAANLQAMTLQRKPWGVNRMAQIAGEYLLEHADPYVEVVRQFIERERFLFVDLLQKINNIRVIPGKANFILCYLQGEILAAELREKMLDKKIMIRNCASFDGLDEHYFRMSLKGREENIYCLKVLQEIL
ncbi:MAG: aminotransferase class I/II-fold pyridoxal phosphate-dependent enzyme [Proteobacteria bacterium]|nr:aminotransferase class I/II-fold pyridoxal phosphate-dependent enzyme [Pseudomonadota bacterium]